MPSDEVLIDAAVYAEDEYGSRGDCGEKMDRYYLEKAAEPIRALIRAAVEKAVADRESRHKREVIEARIFELYEYGDCTCGVYGFDHLSGKRDDCEVCNRLKGLRAELAALEEGK